MKTKYALLLSVLLMVWTLNVYGQTARKSKAKAVAKKSDISSVLGKPDYESTIDSLDTKVWIISQKKNSEMKKTQTGKMMRTTKDNVTEMDQEGKDGMTAGTHYLIFDVTNIKNGKQITDTSAKVEVVSPSRKNSSVTLQPMMNHFGGGVSLDEKGEYLFTISLDVGDDYRTTQFKYKVK